jgi:hypothetical protein
MAVTLSMMAQALGFVGVIVVPIGVIWLIHELVERAKGSGSPGQKDKGRYFALAALAASALVGVAVSLAAMLNAISLGLIVLVAWTCATWRALSTVQRMKFVERTRFHPAPVYLVLVPSILVIAQLMFFKAAVESSRSRAMGGAADFIHAIETYRDLHGRYPLSLASVHHDYDPPVIGVERYHYEPHGDAYNVFFEQFTYPLGTQEFVMYNPLDEHVMIVHDQDLLESPREQVDRERSYHARAAHDAGVPHWKYFWFD